MWRLNSLLQTTEGVAGIAGKMSGDVGENRDRLLSFIERQRVELIFTENIASALDMSYGGRISCAS